jgi:hypothetical protein
MKKKGDASTREASPFETYEKLGLHLGAGSSTLHLHFNLLGQTLVVLRR